MDTPGGRSSARTAALSVHTGHFVETPTYRTIRPRGHPEWLLAYTVSGEGRFGYAGGEATAGPGTITLTEPGTFHDYGTARGASHWEFVWAHFLPRLHWSELLAWPIVSSGLMQMNIAGTPYERQIVDSLWNTHRIWNSGRPRRLLFTLASLEETLLWCALANPASIERTMDPRVASAIDYICSNLASDLTVGSVAERVFVSPSRLAHLFRQQCDVSVQQYIEAQRIERAKQLLSATSRSVQAIASDVGYQSPFYFSLRFKRSAGESPSDYRKRSIAEY